MFKLSFMINKIKYNVQKGRKFLSLSVLCLFFSFMLTGCIDDRVLLKSFLSSQSVGGVLVENYLPNSVSKLIVVNSVKKKNSFMSLFEDELFNKEDLFDLKQFGGLLMNDFDKELINRIGEGMRLVYAVDSINNYVEDDIQFLFLQFLYLKNQYEFFNQMKDNLEVVGKYNESDVYKVKDYPIYVYNTNEFLLLTNKQVNINYIFNIKNDVSLNNKLAYKKEYVEFLSKLDPVKTVFYKYERSGDNLYLEFNQLKSYLENWLLIRAYDNKEKE